MRQLALASSVGFELPPTLVTNDPDAALDFAGEHGATRLVSKQVGFTESAAGPSSHYLDSFVRYTERVTVRDLSHVGALQHCPLILQAEVPKKCEVRATVVGDRVLAAAIHPVGAAEQGVDYRRRYDQGTGTRFTPVELPSDVSQHCLALTALQGLRCAALDLIMTPDDRFVFLESNASGQYLWVEDETGAPISEAIADELLALTARPGDDPGRGGDIEAGISTVGADGRSSTARSAAA